MYSRSLTERIKIRLEILYENILDFLAHSAFRKPLIAFVGIAIFVTLRNSKQIVAKMKRSSYMSPFNSIYGSSSTMGSTYGSTNPNLYGSVGNGRVTASTGGYGGGNTLPSYGGASSFNSQYNSNPSTTSYGMGSQGSTYQQPYGQSSTMQSQTSSTYNNNLRGGQLASSSFSTSRLVDQYSGSVQVVQGGLFHDYGMLTSFTGQVETISAMESPTFVQQTLSMPGNGKVLVVDSGGSFNGAVFDATMANAAMRNGWKGVIINGVVRNAEELERIQFGVKALGAHPMAGQQQTGQKGTPLSFGGVNFTPGNYVYADKEGIVVSATSLVGGGGPSAGYPSTTGQVGGSYPSGQTSSYTGSQGNTYGSQGMNSLPAQSSSYATTGGNMYPSAGSSSLSASMGRTGYTPNGGSSYGGSSYGDQRSSYGSQPMSQGGYSSSTYSNTNRSPFSRGSSSTFYGSRRRKPSKKTLLGLLFLICLIGWICLND